MYNFFLKLKKESQLVVNIFNILMLNLILIIIIFLGFKLSYDSLKEIRYYDSFKLIELSHGFLHESKVAINKEQKLNLEKKILILLNPIKNIQKKISQKKEYIKVFFNQKEEWVKIEKYSEKNQMIFSIKNILENKIQFEEKI